MIETPFYAASGILYPFGSNCEIVPPAMERVVYSMECRIGNLIPFGQPFLVCAGAKPRHDIFSLIACRNDADVFIAYSYVDD